jgi:hypothetical protein
MVAMIAELKTKDLPQIYVDDNSSEKVEFGSQKQKAEGIGLIGGTRCTLAEPWWRVSANRSRSASFGWNQQRYLPESPQKGY